MTLFDNFYHRKSLFIEKKGDNCITYAKNRYKIYAVLFDYYSYTLYN